MLCNYWGTKAQNYFKKVPQIYLSELRGEVKSSVDLEYSSVLTEELFYESDLFKIEYGNATCYLASKPNMLRTGVYFGSSITYVKNAISLW